MGQSNQIVLDKHLNIGEAKNLHAKLEKSLFEAQHVILDASQVEEVDTASIQLLISFVKSAQASNLNVSWKETSKIFNKHATLLGACELLQLDTTAH